MNKVYKTERSKQVISDFTQRMLQASPIPLEHEMIQTPLAQTRILHCGDRRNKPLILIHGTGSNAASWPALLEPLAAHFHIILPDIPGEPGESEDKRFSCRDDSFSIWLHSLVAALDLDQPHMGGISLGAWAALRYAIDHPEKVDKLALISPSGLNEARFSYLFRLIPALFGGEKNIRKLLKSMHAGGRVSEEEVEFFQILLKHCRLREDRPPLFTDQELQSLKAPLLYLAGSRDILLQSSKSARRIRAFVPNATVHLEENQGHVISGWTDKVLSFLL